MAESRARVISGMQLTEQERTRITAAGAELLLDDAQHRAPETSRVASSATVWFGPGLTPSALGEATSLRWFQTATVGLENFLFPELVDAPVEVSNVTSSYSAPADHAMAAVLAWSRALPTAVLNQSRHTWEMPTSDDVIAVADSHMLILGTGAIGSAVAVRAAAFGMTVSGVNRTGTVSPPFVDVHPVENLASIVDQAQWIVVAVPLTSQTTNLLSRDVLTRTSPGVVVVNVGRGRTVDQAALLELLRSGHIRAAALDVFHDEPLPKDDPLWDEPQVLITPHSAGVSPGRDSRASTFDLFLANLSRFQRGEPLLSPVDKSLGY